jgi:hypothetical protein
MQSDLCYFGNLRAVIAAPFREEQLEARPGLYAAAQVWNSQLPCG